VNLIDSSKIAAGNRSITFNYASNNLSSPERIRFRYRLEGVDQGWSNVVASRQVVYSHLGPGPYRFRVIASDSDGLWNGPELAFPFVIEPEFWQTWWFRASFLSAFLLAIAGVYRLRMYQLTQHLNALFKERLEERTRIAQELHDTLLQGFISASMQLDVAEDQLPEDSPAKPVLRNLLELMRRVTEEGRSTLRGLRTPAPDSRNLELAFARIRQEFAVNDKIDFRVIAQHSSRPLRPLIRDEAYRIGREAVVNSLLHARANTIEVEVEYASGYFRVLVRDDGCGIDPQLLHKGREGHWGLSGMRTRSESIGASLKLRSRVGSGTEVELTVPSAIAFEGPSRRPASRWLRWLSREQFDPSADNERKRGSK
jgi:signal transduction histidine kinase